MSPQITLNCTLQADVWQLQFKAAPSVLEDVEHNLRVDERVLRYLIQKQPDLPTMPNTHRVQKMARRILPATAAVAAAE
jgi:ribosomal protein S6